MDILLNALTNAYHCKVILYQYRNQSIIVDTISPGRVESEKELELIFLRNTMSLFILLFREFYVLVSSFKNLMLINTLRKHPTHIGPVQIQH